jgi:hypothetical protein
MLIEPDHVSIPWPGTLLVPDARPASNPLLSYRRTKVQRIGDAEVELWHAFREFAKIVYRHGMTRMEFSAESLGWNLLRTNWLHVLLPAVLPEHDETDLESLAAQIHLALILMKVPNEIAVEKPFVPATAADREATLSKFTEWMRDHGWSVAVTSSGPLRRKLRIRRRVLSLLRRKPSAEEILARGRWTARAYGALCSTEHDVPLYVARGARPSNFVVSLDW